MKLLYIDREISMVGSCVVTMNLTRELCNRGHTIVFAGMFVSPGYPNPGKTRIVEPDSRVVKFYRHNKFLLTFVGPIALFVTCMRYAKAADVIVGSSYPTHWIAALLGRIYAKKVYWNCFEPWIYVSWKERAHVGLPAWIASLIARSPLDKVFVRLISDIYVLDKKNQERIQRIYGRGASVIYPGVDYSIFSKGDPKYAYRKWALPKGKFIIASAASFTPMKNQETLVRALASITKRAPNAVLALAGSGPMENYLKQLANSLGIAKRVQFLGQTAPLDLRHLYSAASIVAFPALRQTWGLTPFEAACVGTPSVVSDDCGASELVKAQTIGLVTKPDTAGFAKAMLTLYNQPKLRAKLGNKARIFVKTKHTWPIYARKVERFLTVLI